MKFGTEMDEKSPSFGFSGILNRKESRVVETKTSSKQEESSSARIILVQNYTIYSKLDNDGAFEYFACKNSNNAIFLGKKDFFCEIVV